MPPIEQPQPLPEDSPLNANPRKRGKGMLVVCVLLFVAVVAVASYYVFKTKPNTETAAVKPIITAPASVAPATVSISAAGFVPATVSVKVGQAVVWTNTDTAPHLIASDDPKPTTGSLPTFSSQQRLSQNGTYSYVFNQAGSYAYHDDLNPALKGIVIVK